MFVKYSHTFGDRPLPYTCPFWPRKLSPMSGRQAGLKTERSALSSVSWLSIRFGKLKEFRILSSVAFNCQLMSYGCPLDTGRQLKSGSQEMFLPRCSSAMSFAESVKFSWTRTLVTLICLLIDEGLIQVWALLLSWTPSMMENALAGSTSSLSSS